MMDRRDYLIILYDYYGELCLDKGKDYFVDYYFNNLSLSEIALNYGVSRSAISKALKVIISKLEFYESKLCLYQKRCMVEKLLDSLVDVKLKEKIVELF